MPDQAPSYRLALLLLSAVVLLPVVAFPLPPLIDLPNHTVRLWLIEGGLRLPPLDRFYVEDWHGIGTNIGIDLVAKVAGPVVSAFTLSRFLLALSLVLPPLGAVALNISQFRKLHPWLLFFPYLSFCETALAGFLNYQIALGLALLGAALDSRVQNVWQRRAVRLCLSFILMVVHPFALPFYGLLLGSLQIGPRLPSRDALRRLVVPLAEIAVVCSIPVAVFLAAYPLPGDPHLPHAIMPNTLLGALASLATPFASYDPKIDLAFAYPLVVLIGYAAITRRIAVHAGLMTLAAALVLGSLVMPRATNEAAWLDARLPIMAALTALAATRVDLGDARKTLLAVAAVTLVTLRTVWIAWNWNAGETMLASFKAATAALPPGAAVLALRHLPTQQDRTFPPPGRQLGIAGDPYAHYPTLLIPWRRAFVPTLFAERGKQPVRVLPPYDSMALPESVDLLSVHVLEHADWQPQFMKSWRMRFDYVLVLNADRPDRYGPFVPPKELQLVKDEGFAQLFRIERRR
jgi:hypothetical protein